MRCNCGYFLAALEILARLKCYATDVAHRALQISHPSIKFLQPAFKFLPQLVG